MDSSSTFKILVCGGRDFNDFDSVEKELLIYLEKYMDDLEIISGVAKGADSLAVKFAFNNELTLHKFPAEWKAYGKAAGYIRNKSMLDIGKPDLVIAFPGGKGTKMMIELARKAGVEVKIIEP